MNRVISLRGAFARVAATALLVAALAAGAAPASAAGPVFDLGIEHSPTNLVPGKEAEYRFHVQNLAAIASSGPVTVAIDPLPAGLTATVLKGQENRGWSCDLPSLTCTTTEEFAPGRTGTESGFTAYLDLQINLEVAVDPGASGSRGVTATVLGGGGDPVTASTEAAVSPSSRALGSSPAPLRPRPTIAKASPSARRARRPSSPPSPSNSTRASRRPTGWPVLTGRSTTSATCAPSSHAGCSATPRRCRSAR